MNKNKIRKILSLIAIVFILSGCSTSTEIIDLNTKFSDVMNDGFFSAFITYPLAQGINWLEPKVGIFFAIAIVTVILNAIVLALTFKSNVAMQKMQELQPEMQKIQAKYEGRTDQTSQQRMAMEMQQLYSKYNINPFGTMIASFIQFPLLIGMFNAVRRSYAVANARFMNTSLSISPSEAVKQKAWVCLVIFILMILCQFLSIKLPQILVNNRSKKEADKHHKTYQAPTNQNNIMTYSMLAMIAVVMYSTPTALSLYYCISSLVNICKTLIIDKLTHKEAA